MATPEVVTGGSLKPAEHPWHDYHDFIVQFPEGEGTRGYDRVGYLSGENPKNMMTEEEAKTYAGDLVSRTSGVNLANLLYWKKLGEDGTVGFYKTRMVVST